MYRLGIKMLSKKNCEHIWHIFIVRILYICKKIISSITMKYDSNPGNYLLKLN
jgi:hypothetical protein